MKRFSSKQSKRVATRVDESYVLPQKYAFSIVYMAILCYTAVYP